MEQLDLDINNYNIDDIKNLYDIDTNIDLTNIYDKFFDFFINNYNLINQHYLTGVEEIKERVYKINLNLF